MGIITVIAILLSPAIAVGVSILVQDWREKRKDKEFIFSSLMATRHQIYSDEVVRALNMIDVIFHDDEKVRELWREYYDMLHNPGLNNPTGWEQWKTKKLELIYEMAKVTGYGKKITHIDASRVYVPVGMVEDTLRARDLGVEQLRVLKESGGSQTVPNEQAEKTNMTKKDAS